jgi:hypothetical protein
VSMRVYRGAAAAGSAARHKDHSKAHPEARRIRPSFMVIP